MKPFSGAKVALIYGNHIIAIHRDDKPGLRFSGMWDLPGGGREQNETPIETAKRETYEELGIILDDEAFFYRREYPSMIEKGLLGYFFAANVTKDQIEGIVFGEEGQGWKLMTIDDYIDDENAISFLRTRLSDFVRTESVH